jgi:hypothetical protein
MREKQTTTAELHAPLSPITRARRMFGKMSAQSRLVHKFARGTLQAIEQRLLVNDEFVLRHETEDAVDGLPPGEGAFFVCSLWLVDNYILQSRYEKAQRLFNHLLTHCNEVGLLAEEFDPLNRRMLGNFPQAYSHVGLINCALNLSREIGPTEQRATNAVTTNIPS